uniref:Macro domain-containing protein n=1 Tax=Poecilia reticulata TaxID=8081 RepID=A0A3P9QG95_POERE
CMSITFEPKVSSNKVSHTIKYVIGDLFSAPNQESLAHCVKKLLGQCAVLTHDQRFIYYLVNIPRSIIQHGTKLASQKPTYVDFRQSLEDMKSHCLEYNVKRISLPRIGCGLDQLEWSKVSQILQEVFKQTDITLTVYSLCRKSEAKEEIYVNMEPVGQTASNHTGKNKVTEKYRMHCITFC